MKNITLIIFSLIFIGAGCNQKKGANSMYSDSEEIFKESMRIHDEVMPKMSELIGLQTALRSGKKDLTDTQRIDRINQVLQELENAHKGMMLWMRSVTIIPKNPDMNAGYENLLSAEEMLEIQEESLAQIKSVQLAIHKSIKDANELLADLQE